MSVLRYDAGGANRITCFLADDRNELPPLIAGPDVALGAVDTSFTLPSLSAEVPIAEGIPLHHSTGSHTSFHPPFALSHWGDDTDVLLELPSTTTDLNLWSLHSQVHKRSEHASAKSATMKAVNVDLGMRFQHAVRRTITGRAIALSGRGTLSLYPVKQERADHQVQPIYRKLFRKDSDDPAFICPIAGVLGVVDKGGVISVWRYIQRE